MSRVLQVVDIFEIWIYQIFEYYWLQKVTSSISKRLTERDGFGDNNKVYVENIDNFYVIVPDRRNLDGFQW